MGFNKGLVKGLLGMALAGFTRGKLALGRESPPPHERLPDLETYYRGKIPPAEIARIRQECQARGLSLHGALMDRCGWPAIPHDGQLLVSHQDALLLGGKVQAPAGYADHVLFPFPHICHDCGTARLYRGLFRPGHHARSGRRARVRPGEMRLLRRLPVELQ